MGFSLFSRKDVYGIFYANGTRFVSGFQHGHKDVVIDAWETIADAEYVANDLMGFRNGSYEIKKVDPKTSNVYRGTFGMRGRA